MSDPVETPLSALGLPPRTHNALRRAGVQSVEDVLRLRPAQIAVLRGIGEQCLGEILAARDAWARAHPDAPAPAEDAAEPDPASLAEVLERWFRTLTAWGEEVVVAWLGLVAPPETLTDIAARRGRTRQCTAGIVQSALSKLRKEPLATCIAPYRQGLLHLVTEMGGLVSAAELSSGLPAALPLGGVDPLATARLLVALGNDLVWFERSAALVLASCPVDRIGTVHRALLQIVRDAIIPLVPSELVARCARALAEGVDAAFIAACLRTHPRLVTSDGRVRCLRQAPCAARNAIVFALRAIGESATASRILTQVQA